VKALRETNFGFAKAEILPGNVGYLRVNHFEAPDVAVDTLSGTMAFLANSDAVIVDLRYCSGGNAYMMPWFAGYFLSEPTSLYDMVFRGDNVTERFWTQPWLPGRRLDRQPMYILTSAYTFSGAEGFAYRFQVLKRATIVGETTRGGANAGGVLQIPPVFAVWMPMGRPVDRDTGTNWEGTGVVPDIKTSAGDALAAALLDALGKQKAQAASARDRARLDWANERTEAGRHPVAPDETALARLAGTYGPDRVWLEGGQLRYQRDTRPIALLTPVTATVFAAEASNPVRVEFVLGSDGRATAIIVTGETWSRDEIPRSR
jgi:C-terminal processing protease CtpA/Prc